MKQLNARLRVMAGASDNQIQAVVKKPPVSDYSPSLRPSDTLRQPGERVVGGTSQEVKVLQEDWRMHLKSSGALILIVTNLAATQTLAATQIDSPEKLILVLENQLWNPDARDVFDAMRTI
jgi:hypothetical protein